MTVASEESGCMLSGPGKAFEGKRGEIAGKSGGKPGKNRPNHAEVVLNERRGDDQAADLLVKHDAAREKGALGHGGGLETGRDLHVGAGPFELQVGLVDLDGGGRVGGGQGAVSPGVLDQNPQAELHGLVGDEVGAQAEALPDFEVVGGLGAGLLDGGGLVGPVGVVPAGEIPVGEEVSVNERVTRHPHLGGCLGADSGRHHQGGRNNGK